MQGQQVNTDPDIAAINLDVLRGDRQTDFDWPVNAKADRVSVSRCAWGS